MAVDWVTPPTVDSSCEAGGDAGDMIDDDTDSTWTHYTTEEHWVIFDMGETYSISKVRFYHKQFVRHYAVAAIYISDSKEDWGDSLGSFAEHYNEATDYYEVDTTDKDGRYVKLVSVSCTDLNWREFDIYGETAGAPSTAGAMTTNTGYWGPSI